MRFTSQHKAINQKEYGKAVSPLRYDSLALILCRSIFVVYGKQSEKNKYFCSSKRHSALHTFWDTTWKRFASKIVLTLQREVLPSSGGMKKGHGSSQALVTLSLSYTGRLLGRLSVKLVGDYSLPRSISRHLAAE